MMRRVTTTVLGMAGLCWAGAAGAALPPQYQRAREMKEVLDAAAGKLNQPINRIEWIGKDYRVIADRCVIIAHIVAITGGPPIAGPLRFRVVLDPPRCTG